jgi:L-ascorbate metabolism protein UlaG (beta-lactamase superfamily)
MTRLRLCANVAIHVVYDDGTTFGSPVSQRPDESTREVYAEIIDLVREHGFAALATAGPAALARIVAGDGFRRIADLDGAGAWRIRPDVLYPDPAAAPPRRLTLTCEDLDQQLALDLPLDAWPAVHAMLAGLSERAGADPASAAGRGPHGLLEALCELRFVEQVGEPRPADPRLTSAALTFVGHNTIVTRSATAAVVVDPYLFAGGRAFPDGYQPLTRAELGRIDAILLTHTHPDHFDAGTLLRFGPSIPVIVPRIERESLLAVAVERRLRELGFSRVSPLAWGESVRVGDIEIHALPFFGEQPTDSEVLHPEVRNAGNTYLVRTPTFSVGFLADSGRDGQGDVRDVAERARRAFGPVDVLFSGYRGWEMYPAQHVFSSIARFLPFVPPWLWGVRQQLMTTAAGAVDVAERWGARLLVPYADGGAPWHWRIGLGPRLDETAGETVGFDLLPERVVEAAGARAFGIDGQGIASPVRPVVLRPGDSLLDPSGAGELLRVPPHAWAYPDLAERA